MALFDIQTQTPAQRAANEVRRIANLQFQQLGQSGRQGYNLIWQNATTNPLDVLAALGTDAKAVFMLATLNAATLAEAATIGGEQPPTLPTVPDGYSLTINADGSITATYTPPTSSSSSSSSNSSSSSSVVDAGTSTLSSSSSSSSRSDSADLVSFTIDDARREVGK